MRGGVTLDMRYLYKFAGAPQLDISGEPVIQTSYPQATERPRSDYGNRPLQLESRHALRKLPH